MDNLINSLKGLTNPTEPELNAYKVGINELAFEKLKNLEFESLNNLKRDALSFSPKPKIGQIWQIRQVYDDFLTNEIISPIPYIVVIAEAGLDIEGEPFCRVFPITPTLEFCSDDDVIIKEPKLVGFPFLVECWNEQPMLTELLDEYIGKIDEKLLLIPNQLSSLNKFQIAFRKLEVENTSFIRQSMISLLAFLENKMENNLIIFINDGYQINKPLLISNNKNEDDVIGIAAKLKIDEPKQTFQSELEFGNELVKISITEQENSFNLFIESQTNLQLLNIENKPIHFEKFPTGISFNNLKSGLYYVTNQENKQKIKIRIK